MSNGLCLLPCFIRCIFYTLRTFLHNFESCTTRTINANDKQRNKLLRLLVHTHTFTVVHPPNGSAAIMRQSEEGHNADRITAGQNGNTFLVHELRVHTYIHTYMHACMHTCIHTCNAASYTSHRYDGCVTGVRACVHELIYLFIYIISTRVPVPPLDSLRPSDWLRETHSPPVGYHVCIPCFDWLP